MRPVCINARFWDNVMEPGGHGGLALRLGVRQIKGLSEEDAAWLTAARGNGYAEAADIWRRAGLVLAVIERLAEADVFAGQGLNRRQALWLAKALTGTRPPPLFARDIEGEAIAEPAAHLPQMSLGEDYVALRLSLRAPRAGSWAVFSETRPENRFTPLNARGRRRHPKPPEQSHVSPQTCCIVHP